MEPETWDLVQSVTFGIALVGMTLGILNTWRDFFRDRVRLRVIPMVSYSVGPGMEPKPRLVIKVVNLSTFAVTISTVGFKKPGPKNRLAVIAVDSDGETLILPRRLEVRESFKAFAKPGIEEEEGFNRTKRAFAKTTCGVTRWGTTPVMKKVRREGSIRPYPFRIISDTPLVISVSDYSDMSSPGEADTGEE